RRALLREEIGEGESLVAQHHFADSVLDRAFVARAVGYEGMELTPFAARIHRRRQLGQKRIVELTLRERAIELGGIDADESRHESIPDELPRQLRGVESPQGEERLE